MHEIRLPRIRTRPRWGYGLPTQVKYSSPVSMKISLQQFATYFRREFHFDFIPYSANIHTDDTDLFAYLFPDPKIGTKWVGGCGFSRRHKKGTSYWALCWIWIHPDFRYSGMTKSAWPAFLDDMREFRIEAPVSIGMQFFLLKKGFPEHLVENGYDISLKKKSLPKE